MTVTVVIMLKDGGDRTFFCAKNVEMVEGFLVVFTDSGHYGFNTNRVESFEVTTDE